MEAKQIKPREDSLVVRHNRLIEARYETTLQQQRIMLWLISEIRPEDRDFQTYRVSIKELAKFVGIEGNKNIYQELTRATGGMVGRLIEIGSLEKDTYLQVGLVSSAEYKVGEGYIDLAIDPKLRPYLIDLKANFTKAYLSDLMAMKSVYSIRLYDLLNQYRRIGKRKITISELKRMLGLTKKYKLYGDFNRRVIAPSIEEINARSDLIVSVSELKKGRKIDSLEFSINSKKGFKRPSIEAVEHGLPEGDLFTRLVAHGIKDKQAREIIEIYGDTDPERVSGNIEKLEDELRANKNIKSSGAWLIKAIKEDWRDQKSLFAKEQAEAKAAAEEIRQKKRENERAVARIEQEIKRMEDSYLEYRCDFVAEIVADQNDETREQWQKDFVEHLGDDIRRNYWMKEPNWSSNLFITPAEQFITQKTGKSCISKGEFLAQTEKLTLEDLQQRKEALI
jgi:hypothetical protein